MKSYGIVSETQTLALIVFEGDTTDSAVKVRIVQGTEDTLDVIVEYLQDALIKSKIATSEAKFREEMEKNKTTEEFVKPEGKLIQLADFKSKKALA